MPRPVAVFRSVLVLAVAVAAAEVRAHDTRGEAPNARYTGAVSEEVARQKLQTFGITGVTGLQRTPSGFAARGKLDDRDVEVEIDATHGRLREKNAAGQLAPARAAAPMVVRDHFIKIERPGMAAPPQ